MTPATHPDIPTVSTVSPESQLSALLNSTGIAPLSDIGWIRVTGEDRVRWLNGMVTNSVQQLTPGDGAYNFILSVQGRIQGDAYIFAEPDALFLETSAAHIPSLTALLDRFIIMDDVELADISPTRSGLLVAGPQAPALLQKIGLSAANLDQLKVQTTSWNSAEVSILHAYSPMVPRFELWADAATITTISEALLNANATPCEPQSLEWLRILEGTPLYGTDIRDRELPQETEQTRALHFAKGCYLGQEIVERIRSRGNVHRIFRAFRLDGELPPSGAVLEAEGKQVGELTSIAAIPLPNPQGGTTKLGLGYIRREVLDRKVPLLYPGGTAVPVSLPFFSTEASQPQSASDFIERV
jgi:folate-binding protein YgfZ